MSTLTQVVAGIETRLRTIPGLRVYDHSPADPNMPAVIILPPPIDYRDSAETDTLYDIELVLLTSSVDHERGQHAQWPYLDRTDARSVFAAIETDRGLGLSDVDAHVRTSRPLGLEEVAAFQAFGSVFSLSVVVGP